MAAPPLATMDLNDICVAQSGCSSERKYRSLSRIPGGTVGLGGLGMSRMPLVAATCVLFIGQALAQDRLPTIPPEKYDAAQKSAAEEFLAVRKAPLSGPFQSLMYSPELMTRT